MGPKIEEITERPRPTKNPFASKTSKTVRRDASEVYPTTRKGLNKPQVLGNKPLDVKFRDLETRLEGNLEDFTIDKLYECLHRTESLQKPVNVAEETADSEQSSKDLNEKKEAIVEKNSTSSNSFHRRYDAIEILLNDLVEIQKLSEENDLHDPNLIKISLHDIKTFSKILNLIIVHGIYPVLSTFSIGIPLEKRQLKGFSKSTSIKVQKLERSITNDNKLNFLHHERLLTLIYEKFKTILTKESDVKDLLIKGTGYSDFLIISIALITIPYFNSDRPRYLKEFNETVIQIPETYELFQTYSLLVATASPNYFKQFVMGRLTSLHYNAPKEDGLASLIEFVLGLRESDEVNLEKFEHISNIVLNKPAEIHTVKYFTNISEQAYTLLININKPTITSCVSYVIEKLWSRNQMIVKDFFLKRVWTNFNPDIKDKSNLANEDINKKTLVSEAELNNNINVLISLTKKGLDSDLTQCLMEPILLSLWAYFLCLQKNEKNHEIISGILVSYFTLMKDYEADKSEVYGLNVIAKNLLWEGSDTWNYSIGPNGLLQIEARASSISNSIEGETKANQFISNLDVACDLFIKLLKELPDDIINMMFVSLLNSWLNKGNNELADDTNPFFKLIDLRLLESIGNEFKDILARTPADTLRIVRDFLEAELQANKQRSKSGVSLSMANESDVDSDDEDDFDVDVSLQTLPITLELLSAILSESPGFDGPSLELIKGIQASLKALSSSDLPGEIKKSSTSLFERINTLLHGALPVSTQKDKDTQILKRAITSLNDPLVPIRAHGLFLLRQLIELKSEVISLDFVVNLHLVQLKDSEPYIYLNVIKGLRSLLDSYPEQSLEILIESYVNQNQDVELDERLKIGEALLGYIESSNELFSGKSANTIVEATLSIIRLPTNKDERHDDRMRMSSMSLLGSACKTNPIGIITHLDHILDCAIGILQLETESDSAIMRRSAIVLIHDLIIGTSQSPNTPFPQEYKEKVVNILNYVNVTDNDLLVREQSSIVLNTIQELIDLSMEMVDEKTRGVRI